MVIKKLFRGPCVWHRVRKEAVEREKSQDMQAWDILPERMYRAEMRANHSLLEEL